MPRKLQRFVDGRSGLDNQRHDFFLEGLPVDFFFEAQVAFRNQLRFAGDGRRMLGQVDFGFLDGEHELMSYRAS